MADPHYSKVPASPISVLLRTLGMTREDLMQHTTQMRNFLTTETANSLRVYSQQTDLLDTTVSDARPRKRSRTASFTKAPPSEGSPSPPATPIKSEPVERSLPARPMDTMQMIMERKSRQGKRDRKDSVSQSRDARRVASTDQASPSRNGTPSVAPETPHHYKYYSERVMGEASGSRISLDSFADARATPQTPSRSSSHSVAQFKVPETRHMAPKTPASHRVYALAQPSSSRASSPCSSPARVVNLVSSPGPMRPAVEDDEDLPYVLPPGPYSHAKPDTSYAAMIGQAILSSPQHRLTLQDIYEWITTVYPHYKRGEQTWMNSVRHALSTMAVFRKVPRGRQEGKSLWAVLDCDLPCFENGGFRKSLCADMVKHKPEPAKPGPKKRVAMEDAIARNTKKRKKSVLKDEDDDPTAKPLPPMFPAPMLHPFYAPVLPGSHHQPYYQPYMAHPLPAEVIFPPLPPSAGYHRVIAATATTPAPMPTSTATVDGSNSCRPPGPSPKLEEEEVTLPSPDSEPPSNPPLSSSSSAPVPDLIMNDTSSSSSPPLSSQASITGIDTHCESESFAAPKVDTPFSGDPEDSIEDTVPWLRNAPSVDALDPGATLLRHPATDKSGQPRTGREPGRRRQLKNVVPFPVPESPTLQRKTLTALGKQKASRRSPSPPPPSRASFPRPTTRPSTPPPRPCTPPRKQRTVSSGKIQLSPVRTPISHRGFHMSPSASLAHYKSQLDPPPVAGFHPQAPLLLGFPSPDATLPFPNPDVLRTPSRRRSSQASGSALSASRVNPSPFAPVTPKKLFTSPSHGSPFRTPSRPIFDPHDPGALLDDELSRLGSQGGLSGSPSGLFGGTRGLLYESPDVPSPGAWERYW